LTVCGDVSRRVLGEAGADSVRPVGSADPVANYVRRQRPKSPVHLAEKTTVSDMTVYRWIIIHWFELSVLVLLCVNLWHLVSVTSALRETNQWFSVLTSYLADKKPSAADSSDGNFST
jgi:hypothetical protein